MAYRSRSRSSRSSSGTRRGSGRRTVARRTSSARSRGRSRSAGARTVRLVIEQQPLQAMARPDGSFQVAAAVPRKAVF